MTMTRPKVEAGNFDEGLHIVDCDSHFTEPPDLWTSRTPASKHHLMPQHKVVDGRTAWYIDGEMWASIGGNTIAGHGEKVRGTHILQPFEDIDPAAWSVKERLELMDRAGIWTSVTYPNGIGFSSNHIFAIDDLSRRMDILRTYNDFLVDIQTESGERLIPQAMLPVWDMDLTIQEMTRLLDEGIRGFTLSDKPELIGLAELPQPYWDPMWDLFNESGAAVNFHIGSGARREEQEAIRNARNLEITFRGGPQENPPAVADNFWHSFGAQRRQAVGASMIGFSNMRIVSNLCASDLFDRYPKLKVVSAESGIGWVMYILECLEFQLAEIVTDPDEVKLQQRTPMECFRDHISVMFWFEKLAPSKIIEDIGVKNVLVETDVPHPTCLYPGAREKFQETIGHLDPYVRRRVLQDNAVELYGLKLPAPVAH
jgi:uncharacterized protein